MLEMSSTDPPPENRAKTSPFMRYFVEREKKVSHRANWGQSLLRKFVTKSSVFMLFIDVKRFTDGSYPYDALAFLYTIEGVTKVSYGNENNN